MPVAVRIERPLTIPRYLYAEGYAYSFFEDQQGIIYSSYSSSNNLSTALFTIYEIQEAVFIDTGDGKLKEVQSSEELQFNEQKIIIFPISREACALSRKLSTDRIPPPSEWLELSFTVAGLISQIIVIPGQTLTVGSDQSNDIVIPLTIMLASAAILNIYTAEIEVQMLNTGECFLTRIGESFSLASIGLKFDVSRYSQYCNLLY